MKLFRLFPFVLILMLVVLPSCFDNDDNSPGDYTAWRLENTQAFDDSLHLTDDYGNLVYTSYVPAWDQSFSILMRWYNNQNENTNKVYPLSNSVCHLKYTLTNIKGDTLDKSSSFRCIPNNMITGFMAAVMNMNVGDTVATIVPYNAGYGAYGSGSIYPYSTLVFYIRLDSISKLM